MYRFICLMRFDIAKDFVYMVLGRYANRCLSGCVCYPIVTLDDSCFWCLSVPRLGYMTGIVVSYVCGRVDKIRL